MRAKPHVRRALGFLLLLVGAGCKDESGLATGELRPSAAFTADARPSGVTQNYVSLREHSTKNERIVLDVVVSEVAEPVAGIAMTLSYPDGFSVLEGCEDGDLFASHRQPLCEETEPGVLFVSRIVPAPAPGVVVGSDRVILRFELLVFGVSSGRIDFVGENLVGGTALLDANADPIPVSWYAGRLRGK